MSSGYRITELSPSHSESIWEIDEPDFPGMAEEPDVAALLVRCGSVGARPYKSIAYEAKQHLGQVFAEYSRHVAEMVERRWQLTLIEKLLLDLRARVARLEERQSIVVPIETFDPEPFELMRPFSVVVEPIDNEFTATFYDANIAASGETPAEAISNLKDVIVSTFELLTAEKKLGAAMKWQRAVLNSLIRPR
jgi:predicted RNase H-like HicB family nuclease